MGRVAGWFAGGRRVRGSRVAALLGLALLGFAVPAVGAVAGEVVGTVRGEDGAPLAQARVAVAAAGAAALTDGAGRFVLRGLPAGRHRLEVTRLGHAPGGREVEVPADGGRVAVEVVLAAAPLSIPGVQVTGTPTAREALFATQATTQLRGRALERSLSGTVAQTLAEQPGIGVRYNGPAAALPVVRGLTGDRILVLQDGQRAADLSGSADDHGLTIDPLAAQRIEVVRGPAALMYGNNALGGVVNVITGEPATHVPMRAEWMGAVQTESAMPGASGMLRGILPLAERWVLSVRGGARGTGEVRIGGDPRLGDRLANTDQWSRELVLGLGHAGERGSGGVSVRGYGFGYGLPMPPGEDHPVRLEGRIAALSGHGELALGSPVFPSLRASGSAQDYRHDELEGGEVEMAFGLRTGTAELLLRQARLGPFREGAWGVSTLLRRYAATGEEQLTAPADSRALGFFGFQEAPLPGGASLQLGGRLDRYGIASHDDEHFGPGVERAFTALSGSVGLNLPLAEGVSASASLARSFRAPTVEELFSDGPHAGTASYEIGDPALRPEYAAGLDAVLRVQRARWNGELAAYRNRVRDFVHFAARGDTLVAGTPWPVLAYEQSDARLTGAEGFLEWLLGDHLVAAVRGDRVVAARADGTPLPFIPASRLGGSLRWEGGVWSLGGSARHTFAQERTGLEGELPTDAHTLLGADAGVRLRRAGATHSLTLRAENLGDRLYRDAASRVKEFAPNPGRNLALLYRVIF
jgi:iron complex outermembrane recepter protein